MRCLSTTDAEAALADQGLTLGQVHRRPSSACPNGGVVAQSPPQGTTVRPGTVVEVVVAATGSAPNLSVIPDLQGLTPAEAQGLLRREGLDIGQIKRESAAAPLGTIIAQSPSAGTPATLGGRVNVTVAAEVRVPDLRRLSRAEAEARLQESSLGLGRITEESSSQPDGTVIKQWPLPGVPAAANDQVDITVAKGQPVPDLRTLSLNEARTSLREAGLQPGRVDSQVSDQRRGTIIDQRPAANASVRPGTPVDVVLAASPVVPKLAGRTLDEAKRLLSAQLLEVGSVTTKLSDSPQGTVIEQRPAADAEASPNSAVNLVLAEGLEVPTLVGLSLEQAGAELAKQLMRLGEIKRRVTPHGDGKIIEQSPPPGAAATLGVGIDVTVSAPPTAPDLRGLSADAVSERLSEQQLVLGDISYHLAPNVPDQTVLRQDPPPGTEIANGGTIAIVLAVTAPPPDRPDLVPVPLLTNLTVAQADRALTQTGLTLQTEGPPADDRPQRVTAQTPDAGRLIEIGTAITAVVETIDQVIVPDLEGVDQAAIDTQLADSFLTLGERSWQLSTRPEGTVVSQNPPAGAEVRYGTAVDLALSASALIPDLTGLTPDEANPILGGQSLQLGGIKEVFSLRWPGTIVDQQPQPDSPAGKDSVVRVQVVGLAGPLTAGGSILLALVGLVWFRARQGGGHHGSVQPEPPPVYGISKSAPPPRPVFDRTARAARPPIPASYPPEYLVHVDPGTQVIQTDAPSLIKSAIRLRGRADPGEQKLAIEPS